MRSLEYEYRILLHLWPFLMSRSSMLRKSACLGSITLAVLLAIVISKRKVASCSV